MEMVVAEAEESDYLLVVEDKVASLGKVGKMELEKEVKWVKECRYYLLIIYQ